MNSLLTTNHRPLATALTTDQERHLAAELSGCPPGDLLKVRATADSLVVVIHTGQKFIYDLASIQAALERLAEGAGRFAREAFLAELDQEAGAEYAAEGRAAVIPAPAGKTRSRAAAKGAARGSRP